MTPYLTEYQNRAIQIPVGVIIVSAGAGTGKTTVLSETVARRMVAEERLDVRELLVLTFTRKAAAEMAERIGERLKELAESTSDENEKSWLLNAADYVPDATIETLDAFAQRLLRDHPNESGLDPGYEVLSPERTWELGEMVARECLERWLDHPPHKNWPDVMRVVNIRNWPRVLVDLDAHLMTRRASSVQHLLRGQRDFEDLNTEEIVESLRESINEKLHGAREILLMEMEPFENLLQEMINDGIKRKKTFASKGQRALEDLGDIHNWLNSKPFDWDHPVIYSIENWTLWGGGIRDKESPHWRSNRIAKLIRSNLTNKVEDEFEKSVMLRSIDLESRVINHRVALAKAMIDFHNSFLDARRRINSLSFTDCEIEALNLLSDNPGIREHCNKQFKYVIVDEYQDINPLQQELIFKLCRPSDENGDYPSNLYVVGDERQSIYGFRDADFTLLRDLRRSMKEVTSKEAGNRILHENFRSRPELLNFVNHTFRYIWGSRDGEPDVEHTDLKPAFEPYLIDRKSDHPLIELHIIKASDSQNGRINEAKVIAKRLAELKRDKNLLIYNDKEGEPGKRPLRWGDCAILIRRTAPFPLYEEELSKLGIPYVTESGGGFWDTPEVADITALLYCMSSAPDNLDWAVLLRGPWVGLSDQALLEIADKSNGGAWAETFKNIEFRSDEDNRRTQSFIKWHEDVSKLAGRIPIDRLIDEALNKSGYIVRVFALERGRQVRANIEKLLAFFRVEGRRFDPVQAADYLRWLRSGGFQTAQASATVGGDEGAVTLATIHQAKGREWPLVILPDLNAKSPSNPRNEILWDEKIGLAFKSLNPLTGENESSSSYIEANESRRAKEESERNRVLYVALTRAREYLILSSSLVEKESKKSGRYWGINKSSWLGQLKKALSTDGATFIDLPDEFENGIVKYMVAEPQDPDDDKSPLPLDKRKIPLKIKRVIHKEIKEIDHIIPRAGVDDDLAKELRDKLESLTELPEPTALRYLVSATELAAFDKCPRMYAYRALWHMPTRTGIERFSPSAQAPGQSDDGTESDPHALSTESFELPASTWGTLAHKLLEQIPFDADSAVIHETAAKLLGEQGLEKYTDELSDLVSNTLEIPLFERIRNNEHTYREFRLMGRIGDTDQIILGTIDLLVEHDNKFLVIDYKSGKINPDHVGSRIVEYSLQLALYTHLVAAYRNITAESIEAHIVFLDPARDEIVEMNDSLLNHAIETVSNLTNMSTKNNFPAKPSDGNCSRCDYNDICRFSAYVQ